MSHLALLLACCVPLLLLAAVVYFSYRRFLRRARWDYETRCRKCGHILRGLTAPRCPECGEPI